MNSLYFRGTWSYIYNLVRTGLLQRIRWLPALNAEATYPLVDGT